MVKDQEKTEATEETIPKQPIDYSGIVDALGRNLVGIIIIRKSMDTICEILIHVAKTRI